MRYCSNKDIDKLIRQLVREGWNYRRGTKHGRLITPDGMRKLTVSKSPSDIRSFQSVQRDIKRAIV